MTRLHRSRPLMTQLTRLGYKLETPLDLIQSWIEKAPTALKNNQYLQLVLKDMRENLPSFREDYATIVHGGCAS